MGLVAALAVGAGLQIYGNIRGNKAAKKAAESNAAMLAEQKRLQEMASRREADIFLTESEAVIGSQVAGLAKAGVDFSGSALAGLISSKGMQHREHAAILAGAEASSKIANMRQRQAMDQADYYGSTGLMLTQTAGTLLNAGVSYMSVKAAEK